MKNKNESYVVEPIESLDCGPFVLEPVSCRHAEELYQAYQDKNLYVYIDREPPESPEKMETIITTLLQGAPTHLNSRWLTWVGRDKNSAQVCGWFEATIRKEYCEMAYTVFSCFQRQGMATLATKAMIAYLSHQKQQFRFILEMDTRNRASVKTAEGLGFKWEQTINCACKLHGFESHEFRYSLVV